MHNALRILLCLIILMPAAPAGAGELFKAISALAPLSCCSAMAMKMGKHMEGACSCPMQSTCKWTPDGALDIPDLLTSTQPRPVSPALAGVAILAEARPQNPEQSFWSDPLDRPPDPDSRSGTILLI